MAPNIKDEAGKLIEKLPDNSTWDDVMHEIYVRQAIELGKNDSDTERTLHVSKVRRKFGLD